MLASLKDVFTYRLNLLGYMSEKFSSGTKKLQANKQTNKPISIGRLKTNKLSSTLLCTCKSYILNHIIS